MVSILLVATINFPPVRHGVPGVQYQVQQDLLDLPRIGLDPFQVLGLDEVEINGRVDQAFEHLAHFRTQLVQVHRLGLGNLLFAEGQQLMRQLRALPDRLF